MPRYDHFPRCAESGQYLPFLSNSLLTGARRMQLIFNMSFKEYKLQMLSMTRIFFLFL